MEGWSRGLVEGSDVRDKTGMDTTHRDIIDHKVQEQELVQPRVRRVREAVALVDNIEQCESRLNGVCRHRGKGVLCSEDGISFCRGGGGEVNPHA